ncbi:MAG: hypothetical protein Q8868_04030 [Bacteroidota bacterium]|nr:hypothetical protein [Bacteroidota bacterium]
MTRRILIILLILTFLLPVTGQVKKEGSELKREVTLYNPYKPSLADARKKSYLPEINDTTSVKPIFTYNVISSPFTPTYQINPIKSASLLSDPLPKLYKSYVKAGLGNYNTPYGELSITNLRSKKGAIGFYAKHHSSNGNVTLVNSQKVPAGFMDNNASMFGKKFFSKSIFDISADFIQKNRYAYGYNTETPYDFIKKDIKLGYFDIGADASFSSLNLDSTDFSYRFGIHYDYFKYASDQTMGHAGFIGTMSKLYKGFYVGASLGFDHYKPSDSLYLKSKYIFSIAPYVSKSTQQWNFSVGAELMLERNLENSAKPHFYPKISFGFSIVPEYMRFFAKLDGRLENNEPAKVFSENPFLVPDGSLFRVPNTSYPLILSAGLKGNDGIGGNYLASVSYSVVNNMLLYSNIVYPDTAFRVERGNHFIIVPDDAEVLNIHGEMTGSITNKLSFNSSLNLYKYTLSENEFAWNKPNWDGTLGLIYNLRNKIIAGVDLTLLGSRKLMISQSPTGWMTLAPDVIEKPVHFNLGFSAEYRYTKILSFWLRVNNVSNERFYEWAFYPSQMFNFMLGFSYSL